MSAEQPMRADDPVGPWQRHNLDHSIVPIDEIYACVFGDEGSPIQVATDIASRGSLRVLDVGCGTGNTLRTLSDVVLLHHPDAQVAAVGINNIDYRTGSMSTRTRTAIASGQIQYDDGWAEDLPYDDASFDLVHSNEVMLHSPRPEAQLREMVRVTAPGGHLFFQLNILSVRRKEQPFNVALGRLARRGFAIDEEGFETVIEGRMQARAYLHLIAPS